MYLNSSEVEGGSFVLHNKMSAPASCSSDDLTLRRDLPLIYFQEWSRQKWARWKTTAWFYFILFYFSTRPALQHTVIHTNASKRVFPFHIFFTYKGGHHTPKDYISFWLNNLSMRDPNFHWKDGVTFVLDDTVHCGEWETKRKKNDKDRLVFNYE